MTARVVEDGTTGAAQKGLGWDRGRRRRGRAAQIWCSSDSHKVCGGEAMFLTREFSGRGASHVGPLAMVGLVDFAATSGMRYAALQQ